MLNQLNTKFNTIITFVDYFHQPNLCNVMSFAPNEKEVPSIGLLSLSQCPSLSNHKLYASSNQENAFFHFLTQPIDITKTLKWIMILVYIFSLNKISNFVGFV